MATISLIPSQRRTQSTAAVESMQNSMKPWTIDEQKSWNERKPAPRPFSGSDSHCRWTVQSGVRPTTQSFDQKEGEAVTQATVFPDRISDSVTSNDLSEPTMR
jgi:hypothetical protein